MTLTSITHVLVILYFQILLHNFKSLECRFKLCIIYLQIFSRIKELTSTKPVHQQTTLTARRWQSVLDPSLHGPILKEISTNFYLVSLDS